MSHEGFTLPGQMGSLPPAQPPLFVELDRFLASQRAVGGLLRDRYVCLLAIRELLAALDVWRRTPGAPPLTEQVERTFQMAAQLLREFDGSAAAAHHPLPDPAALSGELAAAQAPRFSTPGVMVPGLRQ